ncbi:hypothetical protein D1007_44393 [Hordeum vulgare]|nr:hypothetical protein D1007_44393 [Hordeum vulgare]
MAVLSAAAACRAAPSAVSLLDALGLVLAEDVRAPDPLPPSVPPLPLPSYPAESPPFAPGALLLKLASVDLAMLSHHQKLSFRINVYNSCMMNVSSAATHTPTHNPTVEVGGRTHIAMSIEHFLLRLPYSVKHVRPEAEGTKGNDAAARAGVFGLEWPEPLVTFALSCDSWSSPAMAAVPETLLETGFPLLLVDSLEKCHIRRTPIFLYHEHWVNADTKEYHVDVIVKANDSPTSWFFEGPQMGELMLAVETAAREALVHLHDILPEMANEPATRHLPFLKEGVDGSWMLTPSSEDGMPLRFQTYFSLSSDTLTHLLVKESMKLRQELHQVKDLHHTEKMKNRKMKKEGAPEGRDGIATTGGVLPIMAVPLQSCRLTAEEYNELFAASPTRRRDVRILSSTPLKEEDTDEDEDPAEPTFETEQMVNATRNSTFGNPGNTSSGQPQGTEGEAHAGDHHEQHGNVPPPPPPENLTMAQFLYALRKERQANNAAI